MNKESKFEITDQEVWYIFLNNETKGPISLRDLDVLLRTNEINSQTLAWKSNMKEWRALNDIQEIKASILESSKEILQIEKKREGLFEKNIQEPKQGQKPEGQQDANNQIIQNKDENPLTILEATVEKSSQKKTFYQSTDGKWNIYDQQKCQWVQQDQEPTEKMQKNQTTFIQQTQKLTFFQDKMSKRKKPQIPQEQRQQPEVPLTEQQRLKRQKNKKKARRQTQKKKEKWYNAKINTFIYISGLPFDVTQQQLKQFVIKAGVLRIDMNTGKQKLKIYKDQNGYPKGDAAVSFARQESVDIALQNLNDKQIRSGFKVKIQRAQFNQKQDQYKKRQAKKQSLAKKIQSKMMQKKLLSWDQDIDDQGLGLKIVIMKHVIDPQQASNDQYLQSVKKQITQQLTKLGEIQRIRFYETHPDGVVQIKYKKQADAEQCVFSMNGRFYDGRQLQCDYWDGQTDYKRDAGSAQLQQERLQKFAQQIQKDDKQELLEKIQQKAEEQDQQLINEHLLEQN